MNIGFFGALLHELGGAAHGERGIGLAVGHLEPDHRGAVLLLERLDDATRLNHHGADRPAAQLGAALDDGVQHAVGDIELDHVVSPLVGATVTQPW